MIRALAAALSAFVCLSQPAFVPDARAQETAHSGDHAHEESEHAHHEGEAEGVHALHAWARATSERVALVFVEIENETDHDIAITGGESEIAASVELVGFQLKDGAPDYVALPSVPIKAGTEMILAPNGLALRLDGLKAPLVEGEEHEIEIEFDFGHVEMFFQVEAADARQHSHAGHQH